MIVKTQAFVKETQLCDFVLKVALVFLHFMLFYVGHFKPGLSPAN